MTKQRVLRSRSKTETTTVHIRLPKELVEEIRSVEKSAANAGHEFPWKEIVEDSLRKSVNQAKKDLSETDTKDDRKSDQGSDQISEQTEGGSSEEFDPEKDPDPFPGR